MTDIAFNNKSNLEFSDVSAEEWREYTFADGSVVRIDEPLKLNAGPNGHRVFDTQGISHYVPNRWVHLKWKAKEGQAHFEF